MTMAEIVVEEVPLDRIKDNPRNIRRALGDLKELTASIRQVGVLEPIVLSSPPAASSPDGPAVIIAGHRRVAAAKAAGLKSVPARWRSDLQSAPDQITTMLVENLQRLDITPVEEAKAYEQLLAFDISVAAIAKSTGRSADTIRARLQLNELPEKVQDQLHGHTVTLDDATALLSFRDEPEHELLEKAVGTHRWAQLLSEAKRAQARRKKGAANREKLIKAGVKVLPKAPVLYDPKEKTKPLGDWTLRHPHTRAEMTVAEHTKCKGHAAYIDSMGEAVYVCTDAAKHHKDRVNATRGGAAPPKPKTREEIAAEREREHIREVLGAAADVRKGLLQQVVDGTAKAPKDLVGLYLGLEIVAGYGNATGVAIALGWTAPQSVLETPQDEYADAWEAWFLEQCTKAKPDVIARLVANQLMENIGDLSAVGPLAGPPGPPTRAVFAFFTRLGYVPIPEELAQLNPTALAE